MGKWVELNPHTGLRELNEYDEDSGRLIVSKSEDVEPLLDSLKEMRNTKSTDKGIKNNLWLYASIPLTVQYELLKRGINIFRAEDRKRMFDVIESDYPHLKTTDKKHSYTRRLKSKQETTPSPGPSLIVR